MMKRLIGYALAAILLLSLGVSHNSASAQDATPSPTASGPGKPTNTFHVNTPPSSNSEAINVKHLLSDFEFWLSVIILLFGSLIVVIEYRLLLQMPQAKPDDALRLFAITFIIVGILVFVAAGFDSSQIAPAAGLFGTIAGYLLGKEASRQERGSRDEEPKQSE